MRKLTTPIWIRHKNSMRSYILQPRRVRLGFHVLYDKVYRMDILDRAWNQVKANGGIAGVDNESIWDIVTNGEEIVLAEIQQILKAGRYRPRKVKRIYIPKSDGRKRPLGIPTVRDRIVQTATKQIIEPIFEADFLECSYGFRPNRSAHDALEEIRKTMNTGFRVVLDADIKGFFDNIDHEKLMELVHQETIVGAPQGAIVSPLLGNIYLHEFDKFWKRQNLVTGKLVRYADDFVILFRTTEEAELGLQLVKAKLRDLELELNEEKTEVVDTRWGKQGFNFLGFYHRRVKSKKYKKFYTQRWPSEKAMKSIRTSIRGLLANRAILNWSIEEVIQVLNPILRGWMNYFKYGNSSRKFGELDRHVQERLALWWSKKHQKTGRRWKTDFTYKKYKACGVQVLTGNVTYGS